VLSSRKENFLPVHGPAAGALGSSSLPGMALPAGPARVGTIPVRTGRCGDEIGQQLSGASGNMGLLVVPLAALVRTSGGAGSLFQHPAGKQGQRRLLHHLLHEDGKFPAKIRHMLKFRHLEIPQRRARTFPKIVYRRFAEPCHKLPPEKETAVSVAALRWRVTDFRFSTSIFSPVEAPGRLGLNYGTYRTSPTGIVSTGHVQRLLR